MCAALLLFLQNCRQHKKTSEQWIVTAYAHKYENFRQRKPSEQCIDAVAVALVLSQSPSQAYH